MAAWTFSIATTDFTASTTRKYATADTSTLTLSRVMMPWDWIGIVMIRSDTRCSTSGCRGAGAAGPAACALGGGSAGPGDLPPPACDLSHVLLHKRLRDPRPIGKGGPEPGATRARPTQPPR